MLSDLHSRCLQYWRMDRTLDLALDVSVKFMAVVDYLLHIWPCSGKQQVHTHTISPFLIKTPCRGKPESDHGEIWAI